MTKTTARIRTQEIGEFLDWLKQTGIVLARYHEHDEGCSSDVGAVHLFQHFEKPESLLARYKRAAAYKALSKAIGLAEG